MANALELPSEVNMHRRDVSVPFARRSFLSRLGTGLAALGAALGAGAPGAEAQGSADQRWQPSRHAGDDWFDKLPGKHRMVLDAESGPGAGAARHFGANTLRSCRE